MNRFVVSTDSTCDLYSDYLDAHDVKIVRHTFTVEKNGKFEVREDNFKNPEEYSAFYRELSEGAFSKTSMLNYEKHLEHFHALASAGAEDVVHFTISSGLSPTKEVAKKAAEKVREDFPKFRVLVVDPLTATVGQGALVRMAVECRDEGKSADECYAYVNSLRLHIQHFIIADDLDYLRRGGRISSASAAVGGVLGIKPVISFDNEGKLFMLDRVRGVKKAISFIKRKLEIEGPDSHRAVYIVHTGNEQAVEELRAFVVERFGFEPHVSIMGPVIGSHIGPGAFALGYLSESLRNTF